MNRNLLFPKVNEILHGGDYNPEQWLDRPDILAEDIRLMKKAGVNTVTLGVFSWSVYEPSEGAYHFEWLDEVMDRLWENGIYTILATPSGARPAWLDQAYPQAMRVNNMGVRNHHGVRHNHCMTSPLYRAKVREINTILAKRYGSHLNCTPCQGHFKKWGTFFAPLLPKYPAYRYTSLNVMVFYEIF